MLETQMFTTPRPLCAIVYIVHCPNLEKGETIVIRAPKPFLGQYFDSRLILYTNKLYINLTMKASHIFGIFITYISDAFKQD